LLSPLLIFSFRAVGTTFTKEKGARHRGGSGGDPNSASGQRNIETVRNFYFSLRFWGEGKIQQNKKVSAHPLRAPGASRGVQYTFKCVGWKIGPVIAASEGPRCLGMAVQVMNKITAATVTVITM